MLGIKQIIMRLSFVVGVFILLLYSCKQETKSDPIYIDIKTIDSLEQLAMGNYHSDPQVSADVFEKVAGAYRERKNFKKSGIALLNVAGIYDEKLKDHPKALGFAKESLKDCIQFGDSIQIANLYKYVGFLEGMNKNYDKAKTDIAKAIDIYKELKFDQGIAVSSINMAKVLGQKGDTSSALRYFKKSKEFWKTKGNSSRVFDNNLVAIRILKRTNQSRQVRELIEENNLILENESINQYLLEEFAKLKSP